MAAVLQHLRTGVGLAGRGLFRARWAILSIAMGAVLAGGAYAVWQQVGGRVAASPEYRLDSKKIELTPPQPRWIHADIRGEVVRDSQLGEQLSLLDDKLTVYVGSAFALHPWIAKVQRVSKSPSGVVRIDVVYRTPAAMVDVANGVLPVDSEGVVLPSDDFSPQEARDFPRLTGVTSNPRGPVGTHWGDAAVTHGAKIASLLADAWKELNLSKIAVTRSDATPTKGDTLIFDLYTKNGQRIPWGRAPGLELAGEPSATEKIYQMKKAMRQTGSPESTVGAQQTEPGSALFGNGPTNSGP